MISVLTGIFVGTFIGCAVWAGFRLGNAALTFVRAADKECPNTTTHDEDAEFPIEDAVAQEWEIIDEQ